MDGFIAQFEPDRSYGFILIETGKRIFFHMSDCLISEDQIRFGRMVSFDIRKYMKGDRTMVKAVNVRLPEVDPETDQQEADLKEADRQDEADPEADQE